MVSLRNKLGERWKNTSYEFFYKKTGFVMVLTSMMLLFLDYEKQINQGYYVGPYWVELPYLWSFIFWLTTGAVFIIVSRVIPYFKG